MSYYSRGNLAYEVNRRSPSPKKMKRTVKIRPGVPTSEKLMYLLLIFALVIATSIIGFRYNQISQNNYQIQVLTREIAEIKDENEAMRLKVDEMSSPKRIGIEAEKMGMVLDMKSVRNMGGISIEDSKNKTKDGKTKQTEKVQ
ncbi:cell division protein FtsL [Brevibacillus laterosporus]|uniref:Cell division protein FtsL n=1 Tax=Brevibacillus laterosporus TaxID=1465 RepID=A0AAP8QDA4_BRELA|nr:cell division protein FtsL [Brevibacillus laterosporus]MCR8980347.1 cell division protein FtsL [Brevibacillus laterosporus]MCZ0807502.1 cell division protein FtsL [Brevibacillus laterosporus]MCZ0825938.1 cell division protein FtsL [Brevibacillus laterosporus]MCZ0849624.1 cell division protein FtsL [Brevibacillus laterosporus]MED1663567.1 cell division protein FtsL [Brevibacillus laterosporus]